MLHRDRKPLQVLYLDRGGEGELLEKGILDGIKRAAKGSVERRTSRACCFVNVRQERVDQ